MCELNGCFIVTLLLVVVPRGLCQYLRSPCPEVFEYRMNSNNELYGFVQVKNMDRNLLQLDIEMSLGNSVGAYKGKLTIANGHESTKFNGHSLIQYNVNFPPWQNIPPKMTKIVFNGNVLCTGPKVTFQEASIVTTVTLQHILRIDITPLISSSPGSQDGSQFLDGGSSTIFIDDDGSIISNPSSESDNIPLKPPKDSASWRPPPKQPTSWKPPPPPPPEDTTPWRPPPKERPSWRPPPKEPSSWRPPPPPPPEDSSPPWRPPPKEPSSWKPPPRDEEYRPDRRPDTSVQSDANESLDAICGRPLSFNTLVVNGDDVPAGAFPWLGALFFIEGANPIYKCSSSLISHKHVVTAAHCVKIDGRVVSPKDLLIVLGKLNIKKWTGSDGEQNVDAKRIHVHPDYKPLTSDADIAVIVLAVNVEITNFVRPICLWKEDSSLRRIEGKSGTIVGWGKDETGALGTAVPKQVSLPVVSQEECLRSSSGFRRITSNRTFCAGEMNGKGPCNGDSGSGFVMKRDRAWYLRGIVSISISDVNTRTCDLSQYVAFTDAAKFTRWLLSFIH